MPTFKALRQDTDEILTANNSHGYVTMNKYGHVYVDMKSINGLPIDTNSGNVSDATQRVCIATDDVQLTNVHNYLVDKRFNGNYRYKTCGAFSTQVTSSTYHVVGNGSFSAEYTSVSPPIGQMKVSSSSSNDSSSGTGCRTVYLKYIDSSGVEQTDTVSPSTLGVNIGTDVREIVEFKCATFGSLGTNDGLITLYNSTDSNVAATINTGFSNSQYYGIEIPQNGYTLLRSLTVASLENTTEIDLEIKLLLIERYPSSYIYRTLLLQRCKFQESIVFNLTDFPIIYGSGSANNNFAIYPVLKAIGGTPTSSQVLLSAINADE